MMAPCFDPETLICVYQQNEQEFINLKCRDIRVGDSVYTKNESGVESVSTVRAVIVSKIWNKKKQREMCKDPKTGMMVTAGHPVIYGWNVVYEW
eukprot:UN22446